MTRGPLHHEDTWAAWFEAAVDVLPISLAISLGCDKAKLAQVSQAAQLYRVVLGQSLSPESCQDRVWAERRGTSGSCQSCMHGCACPRPPAALVKPSLHACSRCPAFSLAPKRSLQQPVRLACRHCKLHSRPTCRTKATNEHTQPARQVYCGGMLTNGQQKQGDD